MANGAQFSVKIPEGVEEIIDRYGEETHRSKSNALIHLMWLGVESDETPDGLDEGEVEKVGTSVPLSVSTEYGTVVDAVRDVADGHFAGTFSQAARWAIRAGLAEEGRR